MIWADRQRTDGTLRKFIDSNGNEQNVHIEEIEANITQNGTPVNSTTMNLIEKNIGTYGNDTYDNTATYEVGDRVTYLGRLYRCIEEIDTPEEFDNEKWDETSALEELNNAGGNEIAIGTDNITNKTKLLIETDTMETLGTEVVDTLEGNERNRAPSVRAVKEDLNNYSTDEMKVGTWIDGKPIYRKVITGTYTLNSGDNEIQHNISNFDKCINIFGFDNTGTRLPSLGSLSSLTFGSNIRQVSSTTIQIRVINDNWSQRLWYFVLEYTKTTD